MVRMAQFDGIFGKPAACALFGAMVAATTIAAPAQADPVADFYSHKTITLLIGFPPGGGYDATARELARHYGEFIPGHPAVVPQNMPGAGSMKAANQLYKNEPNDGTVLGMVASSAVMEPLLGDKAALFDPVKFSWIGSMSQEAAYCGVWQTPGAVTSFDDMLHGDKVTIFGGGAPAAITFQHPTILKNVLGAHIKVIPGYAGTRAIDLAMHRGEVNGECGLFGSSIRAQFLSDVQSGRMKLVIQMGPKKSTEFGSVPSVYDYATTDEQRALLDVAFKQLVLGRPVAGPPGIPADRLAALRKAFMATMKDKAFVAEASKIGLDIDPASADEVETLLQGFAKFPPAIFVKARQSIGR
jgi:tripartite-type tricarboxylate transporter receptor subunit TctC